MNNFITDLQVNYNYYLEETTVNPTIIPLRCQKHHHITILAEVCSGPNKDDCLAELINTVVEDGTYDKKYILKKLTELWGES